MARDWRKPLPLRRCQSCHATETACAAARMFSGRKCCPDCDGHDDDPEAP